MRAPDFVWAGNVNNSRFNPALSARMANRGHAAPKERIKKPLFEGLLLAPDRVSGR